MVSEDLLRTAIEHHQAGRLAKAEAGYRQVLVEQPGRAEALHLLGVIAYQSGRLDEARELINRAIQIEPARAEFFGNLGLVQSQRGDINAAVAALSRALELRPDYPQALSNLGAAFQLANRWDRALDVYRQWVAIRPRDAEGWRELGNALKEQGEFEEAIRAYKRAIELRPDWLIVRQDRVGGLVAAGRIEEAIATARDILTRGPESAETYLIVAASLSSAGEYEEAEAACRKAVNLAPESASCRHQLGLALHQLGRFGESLAEYQQALKLDPNLADAHRDLGELQILLGDFENGWREIEWRWKAPGRSLPLRIEEKQWDGSPLGGRRILLDVEGGYGDTLQLVRYCAPVAQRGGRVILRCPRDLRRLLHELAGVETLIGTDEPLPEHELQCTLLSLPLAMKTTVGTIPADVPYLRADPELSRRWRDRLIAASGGEKCLNVGLVWSGDPAHPNNARRSVSLEQLAPLGNARSARFYSLQKGSPGSEARRPPAEMRITDWTEELNDWADTAALTESLDLVITVCTSMAHLAGALAKPTWLLCHFISDWRWMLDRADSPWYPTMRIFRQEKRGDWSRPIERVTEELSRLAGQ